MDDEERGEKRERQPKIARLLITVQRSEKEQIGKDKGEVVEEAPLLVPGHTKDAHAKEQNIGVKHRQIGIPGRKSNGGHIAPRKSNYGRQDRVRTNCQIAGSYSHKNHQDERRALGNELVHTGPRGIHGEVEHQNAASQKPFSHQVVLLPQELHAPQQHANADENRQRNTDGVRHQILLN